MRQLGGLPTEITSHALPAELNFRHTAPVTIVDHGQRRSDTKPFSIPSLLLTNANRIINKLDELYLLTTRFSPDIICISESWLSSDVPDGMCNLSDYILYRRDRVDRIGGGVMCYVRSWLN